MKTATKLSSDFQPGTFGFHEMVDRLCLAAEHFDENIACHPAANHPALAGRIKVIEQKLWRLYQIAATVPDARNNKQHHA